LGFRVKGFRAHSTRSWTSRSFRESFCEPPTDAPTCWAACNPLRRPALAQRWLLGAPPSGRGGRCRRAALPATPCLPPTCRPPRPLSPLLNPHPQTLCWQDRGEGVARVRPRDRAALPPLHQHRRWGWERARRVGMGWTGPSCAPAFVGPGGLAGGERQRSIPCGSMNPNPEPHPANLRHRRGR
jgi:hypothetical protein